MAYGARSRCGRRATSQVRPSARSNRNRLTGDSTTVAAHSTAGSRSVFSSSAMSCGVRPFGIGNDTPMGQMFGVNIGCLEGVTEEQLARIPITRVDGLNERWDRPPEAGAHL